MPVKNGSFGMHLPRRSALFAALLLALPLAAFARLPGEPRNVAVWAGDQQITVSWTSPLEDGGWPITGYTVTASPGGATCQTSGPPHTCTVTGLENGTVYEFTVTASNQDGTGPASAPVSVAPGDVHWSGVDVTLPGGRSVAWDGSMWVAVGGGGNIRTSVNGVDWTSQTSGTNQQLNSVAGNGTMWVAVGTGGTILTSTDGENWTARMSGTGGTLYSVAWNGRMWVAGGLLGGDILTSLDGVNWTPRYSGNSGIITSFAWNGSMWMAAGHPGVRTSTDGITWTYDADAWHVDAWPGGTPFLNGIAWNGQRWVAVGRISTGTEGRILTSTDGVSWDVVFNAPGVNSELWSVVWSGREWQVTGSNGTYVSTDGINWAPNGVGAPQVAYGVGWGEGRYIVVGSNTARYAIPETLPDAPSGLAYPVESYVFMTNADTAVASSYDGNVAKWTVSPSLPKGLGVDAATGHIRGAALEPAEEREYVITARNMGGAVTKTISIAVVAGQAVAPSAPEQVTVTAGGKSATVSWVPGYDGGSPITGYTVSASPGGGSCSTDAATTQCTITGLESGTQYTFTVTAANAEGVSPASAPVQLTLDHWILASSGTSAQFNSVAWNGTMWVAVGANVIRTSTDGVVWIPQANPGSQGTQLYSVAWNGTMWVAVGNGGIRTSTNGTNWTLVPGVSGSFMSVAWNGKMWVAVGTNVIRTSTDGVTWTPVPGVSGSFTSVAWDGTMWVAVGGNVIRTSTDGVTWTPVPGASVSFMSVAGNGSKWVVVWPNGMRVSSDGLTWTPVAVTGTMYDVIWDGRSWQTVGAANGTYTSTDGVNWTANGSGISGTMNGVAWGDGKYVTVGNSGSIRVAVPDTLPAAPSGLDYGVDVLTLRLHEDTTIAPSLAAGNAMKWTVSPALPNGLWLDAATGRIRGAATQAAEEQEYVITARNIAGAATKTLSITVQPGPPSPPAQVAAVFGDGIATITWAPGVSDGGSPVTGYTVTVSPGEGSCVVDAATTECEITGLVKGVNYTFAVTAENAHGTSAASTVSGALNVWSGAEIGTGASMYGIAWNGSMWVAVGGNGIWTSTDGNDWVTRASGVGTLYQVVWNGSLWVAVGPGGIRTSPDGIAWTSRGTGSFFGVAWNGRMWVAVGQNGLLRTSTDGIFWTSRSVAGAPTMESAAWNGSMWLVAGATGTILSSTDGVEWTTLAQVPRNLYEVVWNGSRWVITGQNVIITSTDGQTWEERDLLGQLYTLTWNGREWQAVGPNEAYVSTDGLDWQANNSGIGPVSAHAWGDGRYLAVGDFGRVAISVPDTLPAAPSGLGYGGDVFVLITNADTTLAPTLTGNAVTWSVSPSLPAGLWLDPVTGAIRGAATAVLAPTAYTVTARNMGGAATKVLTLAVENVGPPTGLSYSPASRAFAVGIEIEPWAPKLESGEATSWSISPALPAGLVFDPETGEIFGAPSELSPLQEYVVKAARGTDTASAVIQIEVVEVVALRPEAFTIRVTGREKSYGFTIPAGVVGVDRVTVGILDVHGRTLWSASVTPKPGKAQEIVWNGRARNGSLVSAGVYVVRVSVTGDGKTTHFTRKTVSLKPGGR